MQDDTFALMQRLAPDLAQEIERRALVLESRWAEDSLRRG